MARRIGLIAVLVGVAAATVWFFARPLPSLRYAGEADGVAARVELRLQGEAPESVTLEVREKKIVARKLR